MRTENQKITAYIPKRLLSDARDITGKGITDTLKDGLKKVLQTQAYKKLMELEGVYQSTIDLKGLREDRK